MPLDGGGNITVRIIRAVNLLDLDGFGRAGGLSDPLAEVQIGELVHSTSEIRNSLNPEWPEEDLWFGIRSQVSTSSKKGGGEGWKGWIVNSLP